VYTELFSVSFVSHVCALPEDVNHEVSTVLSHVVLSHDFMGLLAITEAWRAWVGLTVTSPCPRPTPVAISSAIT
jgi:hypothetical protein